MKFELTENHIKLLNRGYVEFDPGAYYGAASLNPKRPYGNSGVIDDIYEILNDKEWDYDEQGDMEDEYVDELLKIHEETATALQIILCTKSFEPGMYELKSAWDSRSWGKVE
jgi:hypothetical protein